MKKQLIALCETAVMIAMAVVIDLLVKVIPFLSMPKGGTYSIAMLPIMVIGFRHGYKYSFLAGLCYGLLNFILDGYSFYWGSFIFDYTLPFTLLGVCGLFQKSGRKLIYFELSILLAGFLRYLCHGFSGVLFFADYAPVGMAPAFYSFIVYNLPYMLVSTIACMVIGGNLHTLIYSFKYPDKTVEPLEKRVPLTSTQKFNYACLFFSNLLFLVGIGAFVTYLSMDKNAVMDDTSKLLYTTILQNQRVIAFVTIIFGAIASFACITKAKELKEKKMDVPKIEQL